MKPPLMRTYPLLVIINISYCYYIPPADFVIYPKGFSISIPDEQGIEIFFFYGSVNKTSCNFQTDSIIMSTSKSNGEKWVLENTETTLYPGDVIYYWLYVKKNALGYSKYDNFYNVTEFFPYNTFEKPNTMYPRTREVTTKTRLNLDPYHLKTSSAFVTKSINSKLPSGNGFPVTQKPHSHMNPISKPILNLNPFHYQKVTTTPLNLDPIKKPINIPDSTIKPNGSSIMQTYNNLDGSSNCTVLLEGGTNIERLPLPLETSRDNSKEMDEKCLPRPTSTKFNQHSPPILNQDSLQNKWKGHNSDQTTESTPVRPIGDIWYWN